MENFLQLFYIIDMYFLWYWIFMFAINVHLVLFYSLIF